MSGPTGRYEYRYCPECGFVTEHELYEGPKRWLCPNEARERLRPRAWFRHSATAISDPRIEQLAQLLDMPSAHVHGHLSVLWCWAATERPYGVLTGLKDVDIEAAAGWEGADGAFVRAATEVRLLELGEDGDLRLSPMGEEVAESLEAGREAT